MAASTVRMNGSWGRVTLVLVLSALLQHDGVVCDETTLAPANGVSPLDTAVKNITTAAISTAETSMPSTDSSGNNPTTSTLTTATVAAAGPQILDTTQSPAASTTAPETSTTLVTTQEVQTVSQQTTEALTSGPVTDLVSSIVTVVPTDSQTSEQTPESTTVFQTMAATRPPGTPGIVPIIQCVEKEAVIGKNAVKLVLEKPLSCELTMQKMKIIATDLCDDDCKLEIFQPDNSNTAIVTGPNVEDDVMGMADKFNSEPIKKALRIIEASPYWGENSPTVLVALLIAGLVLAALLIGGYLYKERRARRAKGMRLAEESYQADEENQGNTLVSVAPLSPPAPQEKPSVNGESPKGATIEPPPAATNGHSNAKAPVADTEL